MQALTAELRLPLAPLVAARSFNKHLMLLAFRDRKSDKAYEVVVGRHEMDGALVVPTGTTGRRWRLNFRGGTPAQVTLGDSRRHGWGELIEDPDEVARIHRVLLGRIGERGSGTDRRGAEDSPSRAWDSTHRARLGGTGPAGRAKGCSCPC
jgi:hypothetical protein